VDSWWLRLDGRSDGALSQLLSEHPAIDVPQPVLDEISSAARQAREAEAVERLSEAPRPSSAVPDATGGLWDFQRAAVQYALLRRRTFLADEPGLGKTVQALATLEAATAYPALVVCPASLRLNWLREARRWLPGRTSAAIHPEDSGEWPDLALVSYDVAHRFVAHPPPPQLRSLVLDEAHFCKNPGARRTKAVIALARRLEPEDIVLLLTGTPVMNRPRELVSQLEVLGRLDDVGGRRLLSRREPSGDDLVTLHRRLRRTCYVRRRKSDVLDQLPEKQRVVVPVEVSNPEEYERVNHDVVAWLRRQAEVEARFALVTQSMSVAERASAIAARGRDAEIRARSAETLVRLTHLALVAARGKIAMANEWIAAFLESGEKLVVFCRHREIARAIHAEIPGAALATGEIGADERFEQVARFQHDPTCRMIVCTLSAAGVGLTMTAASNVAFVELSWTPAEHDQAEDRVHRMGQSSAVTAWYLLAADTIDERMATVLERKRRVIDATSDGVRYDEASTIRELTDWLMQSAGKPSSAGAVGD
jgi:SNF2 family DNA or RNA helicase